MALRFDAATDKLIRTAVSFPTSGAYTILGWCYLVTDQNTYSGIFSIEDAAHTTATATLDTLVNGTTMIAFDSTGSNEATGPNGAAMAVTTWYRVAITVGAGTTTIYSGTALGALTATGAARTQSGTPDRIAIGGTLFGDFWNGRLAAVKVFNATLTAAEVEQELAQYRPVRTANLIASYPLDRDILDYSGNGLDLTAGSTATAYEDGPPIVWDRQVRSIRAMKAPITGGPVALDAIGSNVSSGSANLTFRLTSQLLDDFDDNTINPVIWPGNYGGVTEQGGRARVPCLSSAWSGFQSANVYALDQTPAYRVYPQAAGGATLESYAALILRSPTQTAGTDVTMTIERVWGELRMQLRVGYGDSDPAAAITYDPVNHAWIRIRRSGANTVWETAPDAAGLPGTWTARRTAVSPAYFDTTNDFALILEAHRNDGTDDYAEFDTTHVPGAVALDGAGANASSGSASLTLAQALSGSGAAVSGGSGVLTRAAGLAALGSNVGGASADLARARALDGMGSNVSSAGADIGRARPLDALGSNVSSGLAAAGVARALLLSSPGTSSGSAGLALAVALAALGSSASGGTADLSTSATVALDAAAGNVSGAAAGLTVARAFSALGSNVGSAGATLGAVRDLAAIGSAVSGAGASGAAQRPLSALSSAVSGGSASVARAVPLAALAGNVGGAAAALSVTSPQGLDAVGASVSSAAADLSVARPLGALGSSTSGGSAVLGRAFGLQALGSNVSGSGAVLDGGRGLQALGSGSSGAAAALLAARAFDALAANSGSGTATLDVIAAVGLDASGAAVSGAAAELAVSRTLAGSGGSSSSGTAVLARALALAAVGRAVSSGRGQLSLRSIVYPLVAGEIVDLLAEMDAGQLVELAGRLHAGEIVDLEQYLHAGDLVEA